MKMKLLTIVGARPQLIKAAIVSEELSERTDISELIIHTGQHYDQKMSDVFFKELNIPDPVCNLNINGGGHGEMTGKMMHQLENKFNELRPDVVLVYGDTNSTLAGALAAIKMHIPIAHVEAGLRSYNMNMPEEVNRILTDRISNLLFTPTLIANRNLEQEGIDCNKIHFVGDVMLDIAKKVESKLGKIEGINGLSKHIYGNNALVTIHRAENTDDPSKLRKIVNSLKFVSNEIPVVWPVHPRTKKMLLENDLLKLLGEQVYLIDPVSYLEMQFLEKHCCIVVTDSGGVQKEAYFHQKPCVTLREETEWQELVDIGWNVLAPPLEGIDTHEIILSMIGKKGEINKLYGDGTASKRIAHILAESSFSL